MLVDIGEAFPSEMNPILHASFKYRILSDNMVCMLAYQWTRLQGNLQHRSRNVYKEVTVAFVSYTESQTTSSFYFIVTET